MFGPTDGQTVLILDQSEPGSSFRWVIGGKAVDRFPVGATVTVQFGSELPPLDTVVEDLVLDDRSRAITGSRYRGPDPNAPQSQEPETPSHRYAELDPDDGARISTITLTKGDDRLVLNTGNMRQTFAAMNACVADLVASWGLDVARQKSIATPVEWTNIDAIARDIQRQYPSDAIRKGAQATISVRVIVGADGKQRSCSSRDVTAAPDFNDSACRIIMRKAELDPARDADGHPVDSYLVTLIRYIIP